MRRIPTGLLAALPILLLGAGQDEKAKRSTELKSALVVSPRAAEGGGKWIKTLLEKHDVTVEVVGWTKATVEKGNEFDLVIVTGPDRRIRGRVETKFERPILAIGSYGYTYFGKLKLKNGFPYA
jgi:hypothetical protein